MCDISLSLSLSKRENVGWSCNGSKPVSNVCSWAGVECTSGVILKVSLANRYIYGSISPSIGLLSSLSFINLSSNSLAGTIPSSIGNLNDLAYLDLSKNSLSGTITAEIGRLTLLSFISLSDNNLTSTLPSALGKLANLVEMHLDTNRVYGSIPSSLPLLRNLKALSLSHTLITGSLPSALCTLSLQRLSLNSLLLCYASCLYAVPYLSSYGVPVCYQSKYPPISVNVSININYVT